MSRRNLSQLEESTEVPNSPRELEEEEEEEVRTSPYFKKSLTRRAAAQSRVAHSRAAHFARVSDSLSAPVPTPVSSSCPTGLLQTVHNDTAERAEPESWPGPFSTANDLIKKRKAVKAAREEGIAESVQQRKVGGPGDVYEQLVESATSEPPLSLLAAFAPRSPVPPLSALCVRALALWWEHVAALGPLSSSSLAALGSELSRRRKLTAAAVRILYPAGDGTDAESPLYREVLLPDCSALDEEVVLELLTSAGQDLHSLELRSCGHPFTSQLLDRLVAALGSEGFSSLQTLVLTGLYRLHDCYLPPLLALLPSCSCLHTLDLSKNSCLGSQGVRALLEARALAGLRSLVLDCTLLHTPAPAVREEGDRGEPVKDEEDSAVALLCRGHHGAFPSLTALSLGGVASLSDKDVALLLTPPHWHGSSSSSSFVKEDVGDRLHSLNLRGCPLLTDASLLILRRHCRCLRSLDLSHLPLATAEGLSQVFEQVKYVTPAGAEEEWGRLPGRSIGPLQSLFLEGMPRSVTDKVVLGACVLSAAGGGLKELSLSGCSSLTDRSVAALSLHCASSLRRVDLSFVRLLTLPPLLHFLEQSGGLEEVVVWGCSQLRRAVVDCLQKKKERNEGEAGSVLDQLRRIRGESGEGAASQPSVSLPVMTGFLDI